MIGLVALVVATFLDMWGGMAVPFHRFTPREVDETKR
jgi:hypothetical protein